MVRCTGTSPFVRDLPATFFTALDLVQPLKPEDTRLVSDLIAAVPRPAGSTSKR